MATKKPKQPKQVKVALSSSYEGGGIFVLHLDGKPFMSFDTDGEGELSDWLGSLPDASPVTLPTIGNTFAYQGIHNVIDKQQLGPEFTQPTKG